MTKLKNLLIIIFIGISIALITTSNASAATYTHDARFSGWEVQQGIDVSKWNKDIDFKKVKNAGIDFVIVRVAYRTYGDGSLNIDPYYKTNIQNAKQAGLKVGVYIFSQAISEKEAIEEANYLMKAVKDYDIDLPFVLDYEFAGDNGRLLAANLSKRAMTNICNAFSKTISNAGYEPMIYANYTMLNNHMYKDEVSANAEIWLARYNNVANYSGDYTYWQYTSDGSVAGVEGRVDMNFRYVPDKKQVRTFKSSKIGHTKIKLAWNKVSGVDGYAIYRKEGSTGDYEKIKALGVSTTEYTDTNCDISTQYTYKIMTYTRNSSGTYSYSPAEYLTVTTKGKEPSGVENVRVYNVTTNSIWLGWDSDWEGYTGGYVVYRADSANGEYKKIETVPNGKVSFADYDVKDGQTYYYKVMAYKNVSGKYYYSDYSEVYEYTVKLKPIEIITPGKTTNAKVYKQTAKSLWIGWDKAANADGYYVYRRTGTSGSFSKVATVTGGSQAWADYNIKNNTTYYYYIEAYKDNSGTVKCGAASNICSKKTNLNPVKPTGFVAYKYTSNSVWLGWNKSDKADGYVVYKRNGTSGNFSKVKTVTGGSQAWADYDIKKGKKYQYYVQAYNGVNGAYYYSPASSVITVTAK